MFIGRCPPAAAIRVCLLGVLLSGVVCSPLAAQTINNVPIADATFDQFGLRMIPDGAGGSILVWQDYRTGSLDIYAQRVNSGGVSQWPPNGIPACKAFGYQSAPILVSDGAGGVIMVWQDARNGNDDIYAQRINSSGTSVWGNGGIVVCNATGNQNQPQLVSDGLGGVVVAWVDERGADADVYAQRLNSAGQTQWTANGVAVCATTGAQRIAKLLTDGSAGALLVWHDTRQGDSNDDIYARRIDAAGSPQWTANGIAVCSAAGIQNALDAIPDGSGGFVAAWQDRRGADDDIYLQRVNSSGAVQWTANGVALVVGLGDQRQPKLSSDGSGGAIAVWEDRRAGNADIYGRRISGAGAPQWAANGVAICDAATDQIEPAVAYEPSGGVTVVWTDARNAATGLDIFGQRVLNDGSSAWNAGGAVLSNSGGVQDQPSLVSNGSGGALVAWRDYRSGAYSDLFGQQVSFTGQIPDQCVPPDSLATGLPVTTIATQNYRTFNQGYFYWGAVGVRGSGGSDWDIEVFDEGGIGLEGYPTCFGDRLVGSSGRSGVDFVVGDFTDNHTPPGKYGVRAYLYGGSGSSQIEWDGSAELIQFATQANPNNQVGKSGWSDVLDTYDADMSAGNTYWFEFNHDPQLQARLYVFSSYGAPDYYYVVSPSAAAFQTSGRFYAFTPPSTQPYGIVITNETGATGNYWLKVWNGLPAGPVGVDDPGVALATGIRGVWPNPSQGQSHIQFSLQKRGAASFEIIDMAGRVVSRIPERNWEPGSWSVEWDGRNSDGSRLAAGLYFVQMRVDQQRVGISRIAMVR